MDDLISRQAAIDALRTCQTYLFNALDDDKKISLESAEYEIEHLPSAQPDAVSVVRCKDCKWYLLNYLNTIDKKELEYWGCGTSCQNVHGLDDCSEADFCSKAERKEE